MKIIVAGTCYVGLSVATLLLQHHEVMAVDIQRHGHLQQRLSGSFFDDIGPNIIGTRHGEKLFETPMTCEERMRSEGMGYYFRVAADNRNLNYDKNVVKDEVHIMAAES